MTNFSKRSLRYISTPSSSPTEHISRVNDHTLLKVKKVSEEQRLTFNPSYCGDRG
jgi:hypothetical protein